MNNTVLFSCGNDFAAGTVTNLVANPAIGRGLTMEYDTAELPYFTQWKMMGEIDYVMGIEPGNALPDGRDVMRAEGRLETLAVGASKTHTVHFYFEAGEDA